MIKYFILSNKSKPLVVSFPEKCKHCVSVWFQIMTLHNSPLSLKFAMCRLSVYICVIQSLWLCVLFQLFCCRLYWQEQGHLVSGLQEVTLQQVSITIKYIPPVLFAYLPDVTQHPWLISVLLLLCFTAQTLCWRPCGQRASWGSQRSPNDPWLLSLSSKTPWYLWWRTWLARWVCLKHFCVDHIWYIEI